MSLLQIVLPAVGDTVLMYVAMLLAVLSGVSRPTSSLNDTHVLMDALLCYAEFNAESSADDGI